MSSTSPVIETPRLLLKELSVKEHAEDLHSIFSDEHAMQWASASLLSKSLEQTKSKLKHEMKSAERPWIQMYVIMLRPTEDNKNEKPRVIGKIGILPQMACYLHPDFWKEGYATEAAKALLENYWALPENFKHQVSAAIDVRNIPSIKLAEKLGFIKGETYKKIYGTGNVTMYHIPKPATIAKSIESPGKEQKYVIKKDRFWMQHLSIEDHLQDYHDMWSDPGLSNFTARDVENVTLETSLAYLTLRVRSEANPYVQNFAILEPPAPNAPPNTKLKLIGVVGCTRFPKTFTSTNPDPGEPEVGYGIHPKFWGKGYATEALNAFLEYYWGLEELPHGNVKSILAIYGISNVGSRRVLDKAGFEEREVIRDYKVRNGTKVDVKVCWIRRPC